jgi:hypothetical protein
MQPFDHVMLNNWEFMLWHRNVPLSDKDEPDWWALDPYNNKVGILERNLVYLPSKCTYYGERVTEARFFGEFFHNKEWTQFEIKNKEMISSVKNGITKGEFIENGVVWEWNTVDLTLFRGTQRWLLRVMTPGGKWL